MCGERSCSGTVIRSVWRCSVVLSVLKRCSVLRSVIGIVNKRLVAILVGGVCMLLSLADLMLVSGVVGSKTSLTAMDVSFWRRVHDTLC